ncbi:MAG: transaldolase [Planctomycetes bacterium]|nr:transaldolase [Planctomycetota bacterium]MBU4398176.1 transaldolase [Planctomycetota bacterium]MCG2685316.1 transaldolase [Planctomycetales bacterium]
MSNPIKSLLSSGTTLWLDSIDPDLVRSNRATGATGATSNPIIVADLLATGRFDAQIEQLIRQRLDDAQIAWQMTDAMVRDAEEVFLPVWEETAGDDGYVSFELDPLLEDPELGLSHAKRVGEYVRLGRQWSAGHRNRMIKVPATPAGLDALEELVAAGVTVNVTLIFSSRQYQQAREAVWRGAQRRNNLDRFKSVYSIFVSRIDVYTEKAAPELSPAAQGMVGILNAKRIWAGNQQYWAERPTPLRQEIVFASTGTKRADDPPWKYVEAFAGSDIQTNPPATNEAVARSDLTFTRQVDRLPPEDVIEEIDRLVDMEKLESTLMAEGIAKFANPQKKLLALVAKKRQSVA